MAGRPIRSGRFMQVGSRQGIGKVGMPTGKQEAVRNQHVWTPPSYQLGWAIECRKFRGGRRRSPPVRLSWICFPHTIVKVRSTSQHSRRDFTSPHGFQHVMQVKSNPVDVVEMHINSAGQAC